MGNELTQTEEHANDVWLAESIPLDCIFDKNL